MWFSKSAHLENESVKYGDDCAFINFGEELQKFIDALLSAIKRNQAKQSFTQILPLSNIKVHINTDVNKADAFFTVESIQDFKIFEISERECAFKLICLIRDVFPIGAFIDENSYNIASAFEECVKSCSTEDRYELLSLNHQKIHIIVDKIVDKNFSLKKRKVKHLLKVNRADLCCLAKLHLCVGTNEKKSSEENVTDLNNCQNKINSQGSNVAVTLAAPSTPSTSKQLQNGTYEQAVAEAPLSLPQVSTLPSLITIQGQVHPSLVLLQPQPTLNPIESIFQDVA